MVAIQSAVFELDQQRKALGMSMSTLSERTGLGLRTVQRVFSGKDASPEFSTILRIADVLGVSIGFARKDITAIRQQQAEQKAEKLVSMLQGTSALESQAVSADALESIKQQMVRKLLAGSNRALWAE